MDTSINHVIQQLNVYAVVKVVIHVANKQGNHDMKIKSFRLEMS